LLKLTYLELRFRSPDASYDGNPWSAWNEQLGDVDCCQVEVVDILCTFAFPHVRLVPIVKLEGYVKSASKIKWERVFDCERRGIGHEHDQDAVMEALAHAPGDIL
jgi:hypothetical protein